MTTSKVLAWIALILVIGAVIFSVVSMYHGRMEQAMLFTPLLFVLYIFGLGVQKKMDAGSKDEESEDKDQDNDQSPDS